MNPQAIELGRVVKNLDDTHWKSGDEWYSHCRRTVKEALALAGFCPVKDLARGCAVFAALSPRVTFAQNVVLLRKFLTAVSLGYKVDDVTLDKLGVKCLGQSRRKAVNAWHNPKSLTGQKVVPFAKAVHSGGLAKCEPVLDVWALRACGLDEPPRNAERSACVAAYHSHAERLGVSVHKLQAAVWVAVRGAAW